MWHLIAGHGAKLGHKKEEAIAALASQRSLEEATRVARIGAAILLSLAEDAGLYCVSASLPWRRVNSEARRPRAGKLG
jgi:hypothetical protein